MKISRKDIRNADRLIAAGWQTMLADGIAVEYARAEFSFYSAASGKLLSRTLSNWQPLGVINENGYFGAYDNTQNETTPIVIDLDEKTDDAVRASGPPGSLARIAALAAFYTAGAAAERSPFRDISADRLASLLAHQLTANDAAERTSATARQLNASRQIKPLPE